MSPIDLNAKFPELRPIRSVPSLWSVNGCGLFFYGRRDDDLETGSYIQSHCLCLVGIPILALGAYRVADSDDGKYILGREPLSFLARAFNAMVLLAGLWLGGYYGWSAYTRTPSYIASQKLAQADQLGGRGQGGRSRTALPGGRAGNGPVGQDGRRDPPDYRLAGSSRGAGLGHRASRRPPGRCRAPAYRPLVRAARGPLCPREGDGGFARLDRPGGCTGHPGGHRPAGPQG